MVGKYFHHFFLDVAKKLAVVRVVIVKFYKDLETWASIFCYLLFNLNDLRHHVYFHKLRFYLVKVLLLGFTKQSDNM